MVPPFALFDVIASGFSGALRANNAKSGTCVVDAATRMDAWATPYDRSLLDV
jgi:hypothetical protein